eukprot:5056856-Karenia_brevis.AAC.1
MRAVDQGNRVVASLNSLYDPFQHTCVREGVHRSCHKSIHERIIDVCLHDRPPADELSSKEALSELLGSSASVYSEGLHCPAAYEPGNVSLPSTAGSCDLASALEGDDRQDLL